ncbi:PDR/VanB family oxidoreductase [Streptomyces spongiae]|nr:PDR/VanB family oxidoreductase [Streptomyces spongiae]
MQLVVDGIVEHSAEVRTLALVPAGGDLPGYVPGSNLPVEWRTGRFNSYSLTGDGFEPAAYTISVRRQPDGDGGSLWMHQLRVGQTIRARQPVSEFPPVWSARRHLLLAGGIGVTPIVSHARSHARWNHDFEVHYVARDHVLAAELAAAAGDKLHLHGSRSDFATTLTDLLVRQPVGTHLYVCGPESMIDAVREAALAACWPSTRVHSEPFAVTLAPGEPFTVRTSRSGRRVQVAPDETVLSALDAAGLSVRSQCRRGFCGECLTGVVSGDVIHRDDYLEAADRDAGEQMLICVSRARGELVLDL